MSIHSAIEWTEATWNPVRGCSRVSPGCVNCYAERDAARKNSNPKLRGYKGFAVFNERHEPHWTGKVELIPEMLEIPLRRKKPTTWFVNSMSDLFHEGLSEQAIDQVFAVMALCPQHTFQVLTKRAERMQCYVAGVNGAERFHDINVLARELAGSPNYGAVLPTQQDGMVPGGWPLSNVWLGVSVEDPPSADERIQSLLWTPAAVRFLSIEPLLAPINIRGHLLSAELVAACVCGHGHGFSRCPNFGSVAKACWVAGCKCAGFQRVPNAGGIHWVIVGGESGPGARPMHPDWVRGIRDQCQDVGVPFFFKQWGEYHPADQYAIARGLGGAHQYVRHEFLPLGWRAGFSSSGVHPQLMFRCGKKAAGRLLDGREWNEMPVAAAVTAV